MDQAYWLPWRRTVQLDGECVCERSCVRSAALGVCVCVKRIHVQEIFLAVLPKGRPRPRGRLQKTPMILKHWTVFIRDTSSLSAPAGSDSKLCSVQALDWQILEGSQPAPPVRGKDREPWERSRGGQRGLSCTEQLECRLSCADGPTDEASNPPRPLQGLGGGRMAQQAG